MMREIRLLGTTSAGGALTVVAESAIVGMLYAVQWIDGTFDDGVDAVISTGGSDVPRTLLTLTDANDDVLYYPRDVQHGLTGAALTGTAGGDRCLPLICGLLQVAITSGGNAKTGGCVLYIV
jgi:hypothetical protein